MASARLKIFRCGPRRDLGGREVAARVDEPRKEELRDFETATSICKRNQTMTGVKFLFRGGHATP
jgi:hypothetical protein